MSIQFNFQWKVIQKKLSEQALVSWSGSVTRQLRNRLFWYQKYPKIRWKSLISTKEKTKLITLSNQATAQPLGKIQSWTNKREILYYFRLTVHLDTVWMPLDFICWSLCFLSLPPWSSLRLFLWWTVSQQQTTGIKDTKIEWVSGGLIVNIDKKTSLWSAILTMDQHLIFDSMIT